ncbi:hypothetical protein OE88DRAFT_1622553 [Heliocybe sulcata]|uniref:Uncharacterized protein n=1 Tax=Heliocybe sulcata TaxID=5364 RepID=A0A5C3NEG7_9AGAM|nr:hypothetical protein OE88DRAFT_1622553 [Heliocybe sulcata]
MLAGSSWSENWQECHRKAFEAAEAGAAKFHCSGKKKDHRRGQFPVANIGISYGGGCKLPGNMAISCANNVAIIRHLLDNIFFKRIVGFTKQAFDLYALLLYAYYVNTLAEVCAHIFVNSVFACCTFNLGPLVRSFVHTDHLNLVFRWCAITALGTFDAEKGGHLVLWDLKLVIEVPAGSTIFILSAILQHSNIPMQDGEIWLSFIQWTAGGLFRLQDFVFKSAKDFEAEVGKQGAEKANAACQKEGQSLLLRLSELCYVE